MLNKPPLSGWRRLKSAFSNSLKGVRAVYKSEEAFRQEVWLMLPLLALALYLEVTLTERLWLIFSLFWVIAMELINTALEYVVDRISLEHHPLSGLIKDIGSALVLLGFLFAALVWLLILI